MAERSEKQILVQAVYAVACVHKHYGPGLSAGGIKHLTQLLSQVNFCTDASYRVDVLEDEPYTDFLPRIIWPPMWNTIDFDEIQKIVMEE